MLHSAHILHCNAHLSLGTFYQGCSARPTEKQAALPCPAPQKAGLAPPREIDKTREAKLIADSIDGPFSLRLQIMH